MSFNLYKSECIINGSPSKLQNELANKDDLVY